MDKKIAPSTNYREWLLEHLSDPDQACSYLEVAIEEYEEDGVKEAFLLALRNVVNAQGGIAEIAQRTGLAREHLYTALSKKGNPRLDTVSKILHSMGFRLSVTRPPA